MPKRKIDWYGPKLRAVREQAGLSQAELGKRVDLAGSQINKLETGVNQPTLATALAIAEAMELPIEEFCRESDAAPAPRPRVGRPSKPKASSAPAAKKTPRKPRKSKE